MQNLSPSERLPTLDDTANPPLPAGLRSTATAVAILLLAAVLPYANTLRNGFVYDDTDQILTNPYVRSFSHLREIFTSNVWSYLGAYTGASNYWRPIMTFGHLVCYQIFGPKAWGFHLANLLFHAGVVCLLFFVTRRLFRSAALAFVAASLFALHPIHTEPVDWISGITELELTFFYLLTFWFFLGLAEKRSVWPFGGQLSMAAAFVMAMLSKEQALTLPLLSTVYEHFFRSDRRETSWITKLTRYGGLWFLALLYFVFRIHWLGSFAPSVQFRDWGPVEVCLGALSLFAQYYWKLLWPARLCAFYVFPTEMARLLPWVIAGLVALVFSVWLFVFLWKRSGATAFALLWILATLAPVLNVHWMANNVFTERYLYLPSVGFCWLAAWFSVRVWKAASALSPIVRAVLVVTAALIVLLCVFRIVTRNRDWQSDIVLYRTTLAAEPDAYIIRINLGTIYFNHGDIRSAEQEWNEALKLAPNYPLLLTNLGMAALMEKRYEDAVGFFLRSLRFKPGDTNAHVDLGLAYQAMGLHEEAELQLRAAVDLSPLDARARNALGDFYFDERRLDQAEEQYRRSIESRPNLQGYWGLGFTRWAKSDPEGAERAFRSAEALLPSDSRAHFILGLLYAATQRADEAVREYRTGLQIDPTNKEALAALQKLEAQGPHGKSPGP